MHNDTMVLLEIHKEINFGVRVVHLLLFLRLSFFFSLFYFKKHRIFLTLHSEERDEEPFSSLPVFLHSLFLFQRGNFQFFDHTAFSKIMMMSSQCSLASSARWMIPQKMFLICEAPSKMILINGKRGKRC